MTDTAWFALAPVLVAIAGFVAHRRWREAEVGGASARAMLILVTIGAALGAPLWWAGAPSAFPWALPPLAGRMLGAAALAFAVLGVRTLERPTPARVGMLAVATEVYLVPLVAAIALLHLGRFDWTRPVTYGFFILAAVLVAGVAPSMRRDPRASPPPSPIGFVLLGFAGVYAALAAALLFVPATPWPVLFPWASDPLTSRLIAVMPASLAAAFVLAARDRTLVAEAGIFAAVYGAGVIVALVANVMAGKPFLVVYAVIFGLGAVVGGWAVRRNSHAGSEGLPA
jgi:hypothetical protein